MGLRFCHDKENDVVCMYCSTSGYAFGPIFDSTEAAEAFLAFCEAVAPNGDPAMPRFLSSDPRGWTPKFLDEIHMRFVKESEFCKQRRAEESTALVDEKDIPY